MTPTLQQKINKFEQILPCTIDNVEDVFAAGFAPWVKKQGFEFLEVEEGRVKARLRQDADQQMFTGVICGQAIMSAIDTVMSLAMLTYPRKGKGTVNQNNQFLRAAAGDDLLIESTVLRMGKSSAYGETRIVFEGSGELVAHATSQYAF